MDSVMLSEAKHLQVKQCVSVRERSFVQYDIASQCNTNLTVSSLACWNATQRIACASAHSAMPRRRLTSSSGTVRACWARSSSSAISFVFWRVCAISMLKSSTACLKRGTKPKQRCQKIKDIPIFHNMTVLDSAVIYPREGATASAWCNPEKVTLLRSYGNQIDCNQIAFCEHMNNSVVHIGIRPQHSSKTLAKSIEIDLLARASVMDIARSHQCR
jgi:hypothetical protein